MNSELDNGKLVSMPFKKNRSDTYLRLTWSSNMRQWNQRKCSRWHFKINGSECTDPAPIDGSIYQDINQNGRSLNEHRHGTIVGVCKGTTSGSLQSASYQISMNVKDCPVYPGGNAYSGWFSTSTMMIEELCPPQ